MAAPGIGFVEAVELIQAHRGGSEYTAQVVLGNAILVRIRGSHPRDLRTRSPETRSGATIFDHPTLRLQTNHRFT
jgi:hypothetical protein